MTPGKEPNLAVRLILHSVEMVEEGLALRDVAQIDEGIGRLLRAANDGVLPADHHLDGLVGRLLEMRWQVTMQRGDIDLAIHLLQRSAQLAIADGDLVSHADNVVEASRLLARRFRRRRHRADLVEALALLARASEDASRLDVQTLGRLNAMSASIQQQLSFSPPLIIESDMGESDREGLASPYGMANLHSWNRGDPMRSGIDWITDDTAVNDLPSPAHTGGRILFLRTFDSPAGADVLQALRLSASTDALLVTIGDRNLTESTMAQAGIDTTADSPHCQVLLVAATEETWKREVAIQIAEADLICLHLAPKDLDFPEFPFAVPNSDPSRTQSLELAPFTGPLTGRGLLREIGFLSRLNRIPDTILVCDSAHRQTLDDLVCLGGMMGNAMTKSGDLVTPRLMAIDKQLGRLRDVRAAVSYNAAEDESQVILHLTQLLRPALQFGRRLESARNLEWAPTDLVGTADTPRPLPPDGALKIVSRTPVEDVTFLPSGEITEVPLEHMRELVAPSAQARGCPHCHADFNRLFAYVSGLHDYAAIDDARQTWPNARCQDCGRKSSLFGDSLAPQ